MNYDMSRFLEAHESDYQKALNEIKNGKKVTHWIWYIFPQLKGLGQSRMSEYYGIQNLEEAKVYLSNPLLRTHLIEICEVLLSLNTDNIVAVMGKPDDKKLKSCMTLFDMAKDSLEIFQMILDKYYNGKKDYRTIKKLRI